MRGALLSKEDGGDLYDKHNLQWAAPQNNRSY